jgi:hypothetical protein
MVDQLVSKEAQAHGIYRPVDFTLRQWVDKNGNRKEESIRVVRNVGGSPVLRWWNSNSLEERQYAAILFYQARYARVFGHGPSIIANYAKFLVPVFGSGASDLTAAMGWDAEKDLKLLWEEVFRRHLSNGGFTVWQNVVIWEEPAGVAGSILGQNTKKAAETRAKVIVGAIAHQVADVVIDRSRKIA